MSVDTQHLWNKSKSKKKITLDSKKKLTTAIKLVYVIQLVRKRFAPIRTFITFNDLKIKQSHEVIGRVGTNFKKINTVLAVLFLRSSTNSTSIDNMVRKWGRGPNSCNHDTGY